MKQKNISILNTFRNKYYTDGNNSENGIVANAIDEILPEYVRLKRKGTQEVKHGRWERTDDGAARCTSCKRKMYPYLYGYAHCPLCGAIMDGK